MENFQKYVMRLTMVVSVLAFGAVSFGGKAHAALLTPTDPLRVDYEFTPSSPLSAPYNQLGVFLTFGSDGWDTGTSFRFDTFDSSDVLLGTQTEIQSSPGILSNFGTTLVFASATTDLVGHVLLTSIDSQFDLSLVHLRLATNEGDIFAAVAISAVPLPAALPLFLSGLVGLGVAGRRRKKRSAKIIGVTPA